MCQYTVSLPVYCNTANMFFLFFIALVFVASTIIVAWLFGDTNAFSMFLTEGIHDVVMMWSLGFNDCRNNEVHIQSDGIWLSRFAVICDAGVLWVWIWLWPFSLVIKDIVKIPMVFHWFFNLYPLQLNLWVFLWIFHYHFKRHPYCRIFNCPFKLPPLELKRYLPPLLLNLLSSFHYFLSVESFSAALTSLNLINALVQT